MKVRGVYWALLTPREEELLMRPVPDGDRRENAHVVRMLQAKVQGAGSLSPELELTHAELRQVEHAKKNWKGGFEPALRAVLEAFSRH